MQKNRYLAVIRLSQKRNQLSVLKIQLIAVRVTTVVL